MRAGELKEVRSATVRSAREAGFALSSLLCFVSCGRSLPRCCVVPPPHRMWKRATQVATNSHSTRIASRITPATATHALARTLFQPIAALHSSTMSSYGPMRRAPKHSNARSNPMAAAGHSGVGGASSVRARVAQGGSDKSVAPSGKGAAAAKFTPFAANRAAEKKADSGRTRQGQGFVFSQ